MKVNEFSIGRKVTIIGKEGVYEIAGAMVRSGPVNYRCGVKRIMEDPLMAEETEYFPFMEYISKMRIM
jgi:hypothetical protein